MVVIKKYPLRKEYLISYDIEDNKIRTFIFQELNGYGLKSIQKSVFWGYLSLAELNAIKRSLDNKLQIEDKVFITRTNFNSKTKSFFIGHKEIDFMDWEEAYVI